jgi:alpha-methylacyl-CoA racemase
MTYGVGPLAGTRIVMMGGLGPGPFCGMLLGDLGADIVRIDRPGDADRPLPIDSVMRRSQRSIAIDAKHERGRDLIRDLAAGADAFVDVYRPGVAERLGIGPDDLLARAPHLVYARMTGWGQDGPYSGLAGHDINYLALTGALHAVGTAAAPVPPLNVVGDFGGGGMLLAVGLLSGIIEAGRSGHGQVIDVAMLDGTLSLMSVFYGMLAQGTWRDQRASNVVDGAAHFYRVYETADGEHMAVGALEPQFYAELCHRLGVDVPQDDEDHDRWAAHGDVLAQRFRERTRAEWEQELVAPGSCATPVLGMTEAPGHAHLRERESFVVVDGVVQPAPAPRFSRTKSATPGPPALPGDHSTLLLGEFGLSESDIAQLLTDGVVRQSRQSD